MEIEKIDNVLDQWRQTYAPDLDDEAIIVLMEYINSIALDARKYGIRLAAEVAADYDRLSSHDHLVSECILGKLNLLERKPRKNKRNKV